jgi:hypothetical protein
LRVQLHQYAIPWGKIDWWRQQVVDHKHCMMAILLVWRFFFQEFWIDIELMLTRPTRACHSVERKVKGCEVVNGVGTQRTKHCVSLDWQSYPDPWQSWNDLGKRISMSP